MKKLYTLSFILLASMSFGQTISFTGTGTLTANGWTTHSGTTGQQTILTTVSDSGNSLSYAGLMASTGNRTSVIAGNGEDVNYPTTSALTGTIYYSVLIKAINNTGMNLNTSSVGDYSLSLGATAGAAITNLPARIYVRQGLVANTFNIGVLNNSGGTVAPSYIATDYAIATTYLVVVKFELATNTASIFVNPVPGAAEPTATATSATGTTAAPTSILSVCIRQGGTASVGTGNVEIDEIRVGTTWAGVTPGNLSVKQNEISGLNMYPNPVSNGNLYISTDSNSEKAVEIYDLLGKRVLNAKVSNNTVNVSNLKGGVYFVKIDEEGKTATRKLIIK